MSLKWIDSLDVAMALDDANPEVDPVLISFVDLRDKVLALDEFSDDPNRCGERILEAIQQAWIEERE